MKRRSFLAALAAGTLGFVTPGLGWAGSYLDRAALLLDGARAERDVVRKRPQDKELLRMVHDIALARSDSARKMDVPKEVVSAHPHLLLTMENTERAYAAALEGNGEKFYEHIVRARVEDSTFRALIDKLGYRLPST